MGIKFNPRLRLATVKPHAMIRPCEIITLKPNNQTDYCIFECQILPPRPRRSMIAGGSSTSNRSSRAFPVFQIADDDTGLRIMESLEGYQQMRERG